jgi:hypothetical protein
MSLRDRPLKVQYGPGGRFYSDPDQDDPQLVDLDALVAEERERAQADVV